MARMSMANQDRVRFLMSSFFRGIQYFKKLEFYHDEVMTITLSLTLENLIALAINYIAYLSRRNSG
jgi:hypothetical protein